MEVIYTDDKLGVVIKKSLQNQIETVEIFKDNELVRTYSYELNEWCRPVKFNLLGWENLIYREGLGNAERRGETAVQENKRLVSIIPGKRTSSLNELLKKLPEGCSCGSVKLNNKTVVYIVKQGRLNQYIHPWDVERDLRRYNVELTMKEVNLLREYSALHLEDLVGNFLKELTDSLNRVDFIVYGLIGGIPLEIIAVELLEKFPKNLGLNKALMINCTDWSGWSIELKTNLRVYPDSEIERVCYSEQGEDIKLKTLNPRFGDLEFRGYNKHALDSATSVYEFVLEGTEDWILIIQTYRNGTFRTYSRVPVHVCFYKKEKILEVSLTTTVVLDKENDVVEVYSSEYENMIYKIDRSWLPSILN